MPNRPNLIGSKLLFQTPSENIITNTICDAISHPLTSTDIYPWAYTAVPPIQYDTHVWRSTATDIDIAANSRIAFGLFLTDDGADKGAVHYSAFGSISMLTESASTFRVYPIFGRCNASSVTASTAAPANLLQRYITIPETGYGAQGVAASVLVTRHFKEELIKIGTVADNPLCIAWVIENMSTSTAYNFDKLQATLSFQKYTDEIPCYSALGR